MAEQLNCNFCGDRHKATQKNFPLILLSDRDIVDKKTKRVVGKTRVIVGVVCRKCRGKKRRQDFIAKRNVKPATSESIDEAIRKTLKSREEKAEKGDRSYSFKPPKKKGWEKVREWTKKTFFGSRTRREDGKNK